MGSIDGSFAEAVQFAGETLGPLFLYDPSDARVAPLYEQLCGLDLVGAASQWPFAEDGEALSALSAMVGGIGGGVHCHDASDGPVDDSLVWEFRRLFVGPAAKVAPPWGSVYTDRECVIFGRSTIALREWARSVGVGLHGQPSDASRDLICANDPEDHIGRMLLLMAWLARNRPELLGEYLSEHLLTWAPHFLEIVQRESSHPFFVGLARLTGFTLEGIQRELALDVKEPRFYR